MTISFTVLNQHLLHNAFIFCMYLFFFSFKSLRIFLSLYARIKFLKPLGVMIIHCTHQVYCGITNQQSFT